MVGQPDLWSQYRPASSRYIEHDWNVFDCEKSSLSRKFLNGVGHRDLSQGLGIPLIYVLLFALYYERIIFAEEMFLRRKFGKEYMEWAAKTPVFFPRFRLWKAPALPFGWRKIFRREYHGMTAVVASMFVLEILSDIYSGHGFSIDTIWRIVLPATFAGYFVVRFFHKHTSLLQSNRSQTSDLMS